MARYEHLKLTRLPQRIERRKRPGFGGGAPDRNRGEHSEKVKGELDAAIATQQQRRKPELVDPSLILRVEMSGASMEEDWKQLGLTVVSSDADKSLILFSSKEEMEELRNRLNEYEGEIPKGQKSARYQAFINSIDSVSEVKPKDRIGARFLEDGFTLIEDFLDDEIFWVDIELWEIGRRESRIRKLDQIEAYIDARGGNISDRYVGPSLTIGRAQISGAVLKLLLTVEEIALIDLPPQPDLYAEEAFDLNLGEMPIPNQLPDDAPLIGIIDSGINDHPYLADILVGSIGVPEELGTADDFGHGTRVGSVAAYGDIRAQLEMGTMNRGARLCSAKIVNSRGEFDNRRLVPTQMREAITRLNDLYGCRIFVISLGDRKLPYKGGKVGIWAATLDELARELNVVILVSSGNRYPRSGNRVEQGLTEYPNYLLENSNRFFEPAGAANVLTVGSLSHGEGIDNNLAPHPNVRPITRQDEPSPFSRIGPGVAGSIKPDIVETGGTMIYDAAVMRLRTGDEVPSAGVLALHHSYVDRLITAASGTSYSTPKAAFSAAQILTRIPNASANLVRALLVGSATIPEPAKNRLAVLGEEAISNICGHGKPNLEKAAFSDDDRVVLYAEDSLQIDHFAIYRIPIPEPFKLGNTRRTIKVTLAYDPPIRHTRSDYTGTKMSFRLLRGCPENFIVEHFRKRTKKEGKAPELKGKFNCNLEPGPNTREKGTVQTATVTFQRDLEKYGDVFHLVVRCEQGWFGDVGNQVFSVVVEMAQEAELRLYERLRARVRV